MTIGEQIEFEEQLGRKATQQEIRDEETRRIKEIKQYANRSGYTDVEPYEVVRTVSEICVEVRAMKTKQTQHPKDFHAGGFVGHYADNRSGQDYEYSSDENNPVFRIRWSKAKRQWQDKGGSRYHMAEKPYKFYDYNF